ncbi:MAG: hypothetical protein M3R24_13525 [Chloroflexota bacterium]|nr:hypothetical protein [Chloroflexota bacterium]
MSNVQPNPPSGTAPFQPHNVPAPPTSNRKLWVILGSVVGGGCLVMVCGAIILIGVLSLLGRRVESTFEQINSGLEQTAAAPPTPLPVGARSTGGVDRTLSQSIAVIVADLEFEQGTSMVKPEASHEFLIITYKTTGGTRADVTRLLNNIKASTRIMDDTGQTFACCADDLMHAKQLDQPVFNTNGSVFKVAYEVPTNAQALFWVESNQSGAISGRIKLR